MDNDDTKELQRRYKEEYKMFILFVKGKEPKLVSEDDSAKVIYESVPFYPKLVKNEQILDFVEKRLNKLKELDG